MSLVIVLLLRGRYTCSHRLTQLTKDVTTDLGPAVHLILLGSQFDNHADIPSRADIIVNDGTDRLAHVHLDGSIRVDGGDGNTTHGPAWRRTNGGVLCQHPGGPEG